MHADAFVVVVAARSLGLCNFSTRRLYESSVMSKAPHIDIAEKVKESESLFRLSYGVGFLDFSY